jgi:competence protein ComEC
MFLGMCITFVQSQLNYKNHFSNIDTTQYVVKITEPIVEKPNAVKITAKVISAGSPLQSTQGKLLCYLQKTEQAHKLKYGDIIVFNARLQDVTGPKNPSEFNYKRFLYFHQIFQQVYLQQSQWKFISSNHGNALFTFSYNLRDKLVEVFKFYLKDKRLVAVASALTVGYDDAIDMELIQAYASAGALHVLSVSGMHVGLVYAVLIFLLAFMDKYRKLKPLKYILLLFFLMFYAVLTGMSPSVMRSAAMLCFVVLGQWFGRTNLVYNTLTLSAIVLLCYNPFYITEVGFQLSYAAVFGIVFLHPLINKWYEPSTWFGRQIWTITSVSLAAQILTFPLGLLYFHQFPLLFIISNLIVIPCSTVVIFSGIALLIVSFFNGTIFIFWISQFLTWVLFAFISFINYVVLIIDSWTWCTINGITISIAETWLTYLIIFIGVAFLVQRKVQQLSLLLVCAIIIACMQLFESLQIINQKQLVVYCIKNQKAIDLIDGKTHHFIADSALVANKSKLLFHVMHYWWEIGVKPQQYESEQNAMSQKLVESRFYRSGNIINFCNKKILLIDSTINHFKTTNPVKFDYAIISHCSVKQLKQTKEWAQCEQYIVDASLSSKNILPIEQWLATNGCNFYNVRKQGAYIANW